jgi:hypothetical protein
MSHAAQGCRIGKITLKPAFWNDGYSAGLRYPYIYDRFHGVDFIWNRHTGVVAEVIVPTSPFSNRARDRCYQLNGLDYNSPSGLAALDETP